MARRTVLLQNLSNSGSGLTTNTIPKANGPNSLTDSSITDNGTTVSTSEAFSASTLTGTGLANTAFVYSSNGTLITTSTPITFNGGNLVLTGVGGGSTTTFQNNGSNVWRINSSGNFVPLTDAANDIGTASSRVANAFLSGSLQIGTSVAASGDIRLGSAAVITGSGAGSLTLGGTATGSVKQVYADYTDTNGVITGNQTINKMAGSVNAAAATTAITVTNSIITTSTKVFAVPAFNDATFVLKSVVPGTGSFVLNYTAPTATTRINWFVVNTN